MPLIEFIKSKKIIVLTVGIIIAGIVLFIFISKPFFQEIEIVLPQQETQKITSAILNKPAPNFKTKNLQGFDFNLGQKITKPTILFFWASWHQVSLDNLSFLNQFFQNNPQTKLIDIWAVNSQEDKSVVSNVARRADLKLPLLLDEKGLISELYNLHSLPTYYFIGSDLLIKEIYSGPLTEKLLLEKIDNLFKK